MYELLQVVTADLMLLVILWKARTYLLD